MKKLLGPLLLLAACEPPVSVVFELNFTPEVLSSPVTPTEVVISFCPTATKCQRVIDFERQSIPLREALSPKETIAFSAGEALTPQELFFEFILIGENDAKEPEVIASGALTTNIASASYLKRPKLAVGLLPGASLQAIQDRTIKPNTRVTIPNLNVHGVGSSNNVLFAQAAPLNQFPASPFFAGLTARGPVALVAPLLPGDCRTLSGTVEAGENGEVELLATQIVPGVGCFKDDPLPVSVNDLQMSNDPRPLDGVLLQIDDVIIEPCSFDTNFFCAVNVIDDVEVEISNFIFDNNGLFDSTLSALDTSNNTVSIVGVGEVFRDNLFLLLPRNIGDIID